MSVGASPMEYAGEKGEGPISNTEFDPVCQYDWPSPLEMRGLMGSHGFYILCLHHEVLGHTGKVGGGWGCRGLWTGKPCSL